MKLLAGCSNCWFSKIQGKMIVCELISYLSYFYEVLIVCFIDEAKTVCQICSIGKPSVGARD